MSSGPRKFWPNTQNLRRTNKAINPQRCLSYVWDSFLIPELCVVRQCSLPPLRGKQGLCVEHVKYSHHDVLFENERTGVKPLTADEEKRKYSDGGTSELASFLQQQVQGQDSDLMEQLLILAQPFLMMQLTKLASSKRKKWRRRRL